MSETELSFLTNQYNPVCLYHMLGIGSCASSLIFFIHLSEYLPSSFLVWSRVSYQVFILLMRFFQKILISRGFFHVFSELQFSDFFFHLFFFDAVRFHLTFTFLFLFWCFPDLVVLFLPVFFVSPFFFIISMEHIPLPNVISISWLDILKIYLSCYFLGTSKNS